MIQQTAPEDRISLGQKFAYAIGMLVNNLQAAALPAMMVILNLGLGMDPALVGIIGFVPRIFDAVSDPMMGYISDHTRSRWGRRRPYIFAAPRSWPGSCSRRCGRCPRATLKRPISGSFSSLR